MFLQVKKLIYLFGGRGAGGKALNLISCIEVKVNNMLFILLDADHPVEMETVEFYSYLEYSPSTFISVLIEGYSQASINVMRPRAFQDYFCLYEAN